MALVELPQSLDCSGSGVADFHPLYFPISLDADTVFVEANDVLGTTRGRPLCSGLISRWDSFLAWLILTLKSFDFPGAMALSEGPICSV